MLKKPDHLLLISIGIISTLFIFAVTAINEWHLVFDDSYISYRYARNIADGYGLTWNVGEASTEGYSNLLLILILVPFIKLGIDPLIATRVLSILSIIGTYLILRKSLGKRFELSVFGATILAGIFLIHPALKHLWLVGLETIIFTFLLFFSYLKGSKALSTPNISHISLFATSVFVAELLRPEALLLYAAFFLVAFHRMIRKEMSALHLGVGTLLFVCLNCFFYAWKYHYFGDFLPNPYYIKATSNQIVDLRGLSSVIAFLSTNKFLLLIIILPFVLTTASKYGASHAKGSHDTLFAGLFILLNILFFAHTATLMDIQGRFLFPLTPFLVYLSAPGFLFLADCTRDIGARKLFLFFCFLTVPILYSNLSLSYMQGAYKFAIAPHQFMQRKLSTDDLGSKELKVARALQGYEDIKNLRIAFGDAGVIAYFSRALWLDTVGLNDSFIARNKEVDKLLGYFFRVSPDIFIGALTKDLKWITYGHGPMGDFTKLSDDSRWDDYVYIGTAKTAGTSYDLQFFLNKNSKHFDSMKKFLEANVIDGKFDFFPAQFGTYKPTNTPQWKPSANISSGNF